MQVLPKIAKPSLYLIRSLLFFFSLVVVGYTLVNLEGNGFYLEVKRPLVLLLILLFLPLNIFLEAMRWRAISFHLTELKLKESFQIVLGGMTAGFLTPMRVGEYWSRAVTTRSGNKIQLVLLQLVNGYLMFLVTMVLTALSLVIIDKNLLPEILMSYSNLTTNLLSVSLVIFSSIIFLFFLLPKWKAIQLQPSGIIASFGFTILRFSVFVVQYLLAFEFFGVQSSILDLMQGVIIFLGVVTLLPSFILSRLGIREAAAIYVIGIPFGLESQVVMVSLLIWLVNQVIPALAGAWIFRVTPEKTEQ